MNEHFVLTGSAHQIKIIENVRKSFGDYGIRWIISHDVPKAKNINGEWHPALGAWTLKRIIGGKFKGYSKAKEAKRKAKEFKREYGKDYTAPVNV